jgi:hypothetical protein
LAVEYLINSDLRKIVTNSRSRFLVKPEDFQQVIEQWLSGYPQEYLFLSLPYVQRSKRNPSVQAWETGQKSNWDDEFDKFVEFLYSVLVSYLPWILRACGIMAKVIDGWSKEIDWRLWADFIEIGVDSRWALEALEKDVNHNRKILCMVGRSWPADFTAPADPLGTGYLQYDDVQAQVHRLFSKVRQSLDPGALVDIRDLQATYAWLFNKVGVVPNELL